MSRDTDDVIDDAKTSYFKAWFLILGSCARAMNLFCLLSFLGKKVIQTIDNCVTFTRVLETEGHVMIYVTFIISACMCHIMMIFMLFRIVFRYRNSFQLTPFA